MDTLLLTIFIVCYIGCEFAASDEINATTLEALQNRVSNLDAMIFDFQYQLQNMEYDLLRRIFQSAKGSIDSLVFKDPRPPCYDDFINHMGLDISMMTAEDAEDIPCFAKSDATDRHLKTTRDEKLVRIRRYIAMLSECVENQKPDCDSERKYRNLTASVTEIESYLHRTEAEFFDMENIIHFCVKGFLDSIKDNLKKILKSVESCKTVGAYNETLKEMSLWPLSLSALANYTEKENVPNAYERTHKLSSKEVVEHNKIAKRRIALSDNMLNYTESISNFLAYEKNNAIWDIRDVVTAHAKKERPLVNAENLECFEESVPYLKNNITAYWKANVFRQCFFPLQDLHRNISQLVWHNLTRINSRLGETLNCRKGKICTQSLRDILKMEAWLTFWQLVNQTEMKENVKTCLREAHNVIDKNIRLYKEKFRNCESFPFANEMFFELRRGDHGYPPFLTANAQLNLTTFCPQCKNLNYVTDPDYKLLYVILNIP